MKVGGKRVCVLGAFEACGSPSLCDEHQNRGCIADLSSPEQNELPAVPQRLQVVSGEVHHGWLLSSLPAHNRIVLILAWCSAPDGKGMRFYHDNIRVGNADPLSWTK